MIRKTIESFIFPLILLTFCHQTFASTFNFNARDPKIVHPRQSLSCDVPEMRGKMDIESTPEIEELVRGLRGDPVKLYEFVRNNIDYMPTFGLGKGPTMTMLDRQGNDIEQSALLIALLTEAGYSPVYVNGRIEISGEQVMSWLGIPDNPTLARDVFESAGKSEVFVLSTGDSIDSVILEHVWVKVSIDGTDYVFDPSFKQYQYATGIDIGTAMSFDKADLLAGAIDGMISGENYLQNLNRGNIRSDMAQYAGNLVSTLENDWPDADMNHILGGREIIPEVGEPLQTILPHFHSVNEEWPGNEPFYVTRFAFYYQVNTCPGTGNFEFTLDACDIYGKCLMLYMTPGEEDLVIHVMLEGEEIAEGIWTEMNTFSAEIQHPSLRGEGTYLDQYFESYHVEQDGSYCFFLGFGTTGRAAIEKHRKQLAQLLHDGLAPDSEAVMGESLLISGLTYLSEIGYANKINDNICESLTLRHQDFGWMAHKDSMFMNHVAARTKLGLDGTAYPLPESFYIEAAFNSALEWGVIDQMQPMSAVSTVKLVDQAIELGYKIFDTDVSSWEAVFPQLVGYTPQQQHWLEHYIIVLGYRLILPENGALISGSYEGPALYAISDNTMIALIMGGLNGGFGIDIADLDPQSCLTSQVDYFDDTNNPSTEEPIDLFSGNYLYSKTDLSTGEASLPFGLGFERRYNSGSRLHASPIGLGWSHNFDISATPGSDGFRCLGGMSPVDSVTTIVSVFACSELLKDGLLTDRMLIFNTIQKWCAEHLVDNVVNIRSFGTNTQFLKLADGTYYPEAGRWARLEKSPDDRFTMTTRHGIRLDFGSDGRIETWQDPNGNTVEYNYVSGLLTGVGNGMERSLSFVYDSNERITSVTDQSGRQVTCDYDSSGNLTTVTDPMSHDSVYQYDLPGRMVSCFTPADPAIPFMINTWDQLDRVIEQQDFSGNIYEYFYADRTSTEETLPSGVSRMWRYRKTEQVESFIDPVGNVTSFEYDGLGRISRMIHPEGNGREYRYDSHHNVTRLVLFPKTGSVEPDIEIRYFFEPEFNHPSQTIDPLGHITDFSYDAKGNLVQRLLPEADGVRHAFNYTVNSMGRIDSISGPEFWSQTFTYDPLTGELLSTTTDPGGLNITVSTMFDPVGNPVQTTQAAGFSWDYEYDLNRRLIRMTAPAPFGIETQFGYDEDGRIESILRETGDPVQPWQTFEAQYNTGGAEISSEIPGRSQSNSTYNIHQSLWKQTYSDGSVDEFLYDELDRPWRRIDPAGQIAEEITYTSNGKISQMRDANGNTTTYFYDDFDRLFREVHSDGSFNEYTFDSAGNLLQHRNRKGDLVQYQYDELNRLEFRTLPGPVVMAYTYDGLGRMRSMTDSDGTTDYDYDGAGRLIAVSDHANRTIQYEYDANNNPSRLTYPDGYYLTYEYDTLNRLQRIFENGTSLLAEYSYDSLSRRMSVVYGNGVMTEYQHSMSNALSSVETAFSNGTATLEWDYDDLGRVIRFVASHPEFVHQPELTAGGAFTVNELNQYSSFNSDTLDYDNAGNLLGLNGFSFSYNADNQLVSATSPGHAISYQVNGIGQRSGRTIDGVTTDFLNDGLHLLAEYDDSGTLIRRYIHGPGLDDPAMMQSGSDQYYYHLDHLNSVAALSDATGNRVETYAYSPFGSPSGASVSGNPFRFTGREYEPLTGLCYYRNRSYSPDLGRFISPDRLGILGGDLNYYTYVRNNPVNYVDPLGLSPEKKVRFNWKTFKEGSWSIVKGTIAAGCTITIEAGSVGTLTPVAIVTGSYAAFELGSGIGNVYNSVAYPEFDTTPTAPLEMIGYASGNDNLQYAGKVTDDVVQLIYSPTDKDPTTICGLYFSGAAESIDPITKVEDLESYYNYSKDAYGFLGTSMNPVPYHVPQGQYEDYIHIEDGNGASVAVPPAGVYDNF